MEPISDYTIRTMTRSEIDLAVEWAALEGWNPGTDDAECFYRADPDGFLVGLVGNKPVATISVVRYGSSFGFLGFYIVRPEYRGMGLGPPIWNAGLARLEGRSVGLDGVVAQQENYTKSGFRLAYRNIRYMGVGGGNHEKQNGIKPLSDILFEEIVSFDRQFFPEDRRSFLECWIKRNGSTALGFNDNGRLSGYGVIRPCRSGFKIGPLFADSPELAETLFCSLKSSIPEGSPFFLDIPEVNPEAISLVKRHNMSIVFETARMYKGIPPRLPLDRIFGVTTFELG
ncbi:MAG TPA: GNAT family N-acetyltransferase [Chlorobaculum sp.]|nr:GNAT family N-acetyltransferase [Chlorobaculum sp.]